MDEEFEQELYQEPDYETWEKNELDRDREAGEFEPIDNPAGLRDLPVELQDAIQDILAFYLDVTQDDQAEFDFEGEGEMVPHWEEARQMYHDLSGAWRVRGGDIYQNTDPLIDKPKEI